MDKQLKFVMLLFVLVCGAAKAQMPILPGMFNPNVPSFPLITVDAGMFSVGNPYSTGTTMTQAIANAMTSCGTGCTVSTGGGATQVTWNTAVTGFTVGAYQSHCSNLGPVKLVGSTTYAAGALTNNNFAFANSNTFTQIDFGMGYGIAPAAATMGTCLSAPSLSVTGGNIIDTGPAMFDLSGNYIMTQIYYTGSATAIRLESGPNAVLHSNGYVISTPNTFLLSTNYTVTTGSLYSGTYTSGGSITGTSGQTCNLTYIGGGGTGATATVTLTGTNTIASGTAVVMTPSGQSGYSSTSTSATLSSGTATCSGTATVATVLGGLGTLSIHNATTGALLATETVINLAGSTVQKFGVGNNENQTNSGTNYFGPIYMQWTSPQNDMFGAW